MKGFSFLHGGRFLLPCLLMVICYANGLPMGQTVSADTILVTKKEVLEKDTVVDTLQEVVVTKELVEDNGMTKTYLITKEMLEKSFNTAALIDNLPGMRVDLLNNVITYLGRDKIKILVDSIEKNEDHVKRLNPKRFEKVEVTVMPSGRYAGYDVLINLKLKPTYTGSELQLTSLDGIAPNYLESDKLATSYDRVLFDYMRNGWNFYANATYNWFYSEELESYDTHYILEGIVEKSLPYSKDKPTSHDYSRGVKVALNADYTINPHHIVGGLYEWGLSNADAFTNIGYTQENLGTNRSSEFTTNDIARTDKTSHFAGIFYEGRNLKGWSIGAKAQFYIDDTKSDNTYSRSNGYDQIYLTRPTMNFTFVGVNINRYLSNRLQLNIDYNFLNRNRRVRDNDKKDLTKLRENRQYAVASLTCYAGNRTYLTGGVGFLNSNVVSSGEKTVSNELEFRFIARHSFNNNLGLAASYVLESKVPSTTQLSDYGQFVNPYLYEGGIRN